MLAQRLTSRTRYSFALRACGVWPAGCPDLRVSPLRRTGLPCTRRRRVGTLTSCNCSWSRAPTLTQKTRYLAAAPSLTRTQLSVRRSAPQDGRTALHLAAAGGNADVALLLLEKSDADAEDEAGNTPAWAAFAAKKSSLARRIISEGEADISAACEHGKTYLHGAAERNDPADAAWLLEQGAAVDAKDMRSDTPLHAAAAAGAWAVGQLLVLAGANVNARGKVRASETRQCHARRALRRSVRPPGGGCTSRRKRARRCMSLRAIRRVPLVTLSSWPCC
jgi:hypothetical protein